MTDLRQTKEYAKYMHLLGWQVHQFQISNVTLRLRSGQECQIFVKKIPLIGNIAKLQRPSDKIEIKEIRSFVEKNKIAVLYLEPILHYSYYISHNFLLAKNCFLPSKTIHINLLQRNKALFSQMDKDTRYAIRTAQKRGVIVEKSRDIEVFIKLWTQSARSRGMWLPQTKEIRALWTAFGPKAYLFLTHTTYPILHTSNPIAGILMVRTPTTAYYMYAASTKEGNKLSAPSLLVWEAIKLAKKKGCKVFDFEGIYDERYPQTKSWKGFTKFKEGFGEKRITYPRTLVGYYSLIAKFLKL